MAKHTSIVPLFLLAGLVPAAVGCNVGGSKSVADRDQVPGRASASTSGSWNPLAAKPANPDLPILSADEEKEYQEAREELDDPARLYLPLARLQESEGRLDEARTSYAIVLREDPRSKDALLGLARLDQLAGRPAEAEERFRRVAASHPDDAHVLDSLGQFYAAESRWAEAARTLDVAAGLAPDDATIRFHVAVATAHTGDVERARAHFARVVAPGEAHYNLGHILFEHGRLEEAEREFIAAITRQPGLEQAQVMLGELRSQRDREMQFAGGAPAGRTGTRPAVEVRPGQPTTGVRTAHHRSDAHGTGQHVQHATVVQPSQRTDRTAAAPHAANSHAGTYEAPAGWARNEPATEWDASDFQQPIPAPSGSATMSPAQLEQMRNQW